MTSPPDASVPPEVLARRGADVAAAALAAPAVALAAATAALAAAAVGLPGGRATTAASALAARWELAATLWTADALAHGEALGAAAGDYAEGDDAVATTFGSR
jgi:hypothetical protein